MTHLSVILPVIELTEFHARLTDNAIRNLRQTAAGPFELVIVETAESPRLVSAADIHVHKGERSCYSADFNAGLVAASGTFFAQTANDLVLGAGWDDALLAPWRSRSDCGAATLLSTAHSAEHRTDIEEGFHGPIMAFPRGWTLDAEEFPNIFSDTDLVMRIYREGRRMYRNWSVRAHHIGGGEQTWRDVAGPDKGAIFMAARERFRARHQDCGLMMFRALYEGWRV